MSHSTSNPGARLREGVHAVRPDEGRRLLEVWEASVRATHAFLTEADIERFRPLVLEELTRLSALRCVRDTAGDIVGFVGVLAGKMEALFVHPSWHRAGVGRRLVQHATNVLGATTVDVNEQNPQAVAFYERMGFEVASRSDVDSMGLPFPLLHMRLAGR